jgi:hypothetical protein
MATFPLVQGPLVAGDRLTRDEFLRRWEEMPDLKKAELIGGVFTWLPRSVSAQLRLCAAETFRHWSAR